MEEKVIKKRGGKREGAGRPPKEDSKIQISMKLDRDLNDVFCSQTFAIKHNNRNRYINDAVREAMKKDLFILD